MPSAFQSSITLYFQTRHNWTPPWHRIKLVPNGYALRLGSLLCHDNNATTIATPWGYEIHYREGIPEAVMAHELQHIRDMERMGVGRYVLEYAWEMRRGYRANRFEVEARNVANQYGGSNK